MTVTTSDRVNAVIDGILARLETYKDDLLISAAEENYPPPLPTEDYAYVMPLLKGGDQMNTHAGGGMGHTFSVTIEIYKTYKNNTEGLRPIRNRGYALADLFCKGSNAVLTVEHDGTPVHAFTKNPNLDSGAFLTQKGNPVMFWCSVTFQVKMEE